jgi:hypothetical protein
MTFRNDLVASKAQCHRGFRSRQAHDHASFVLQPQTSSAKSFPAGGSGALGIGTWEFGDVIELVDLTGGLNSGADRRKRIFLASVGEKLPYPRQHPGGRRR